MKVQAVPVKSRTGPSMEGQKQNAVKEDFLSILKERSTGSGEAAKNEKTPVKKAEKREQPSKNKDAKASEKAEETGGQLAQETLSGEDPKPEETKAAAEAESQGLAGSEEAQGKLETVLSEVVPVYQNLVFGLSKLSEGGTRNYVETAKKNDSAALPKQVGEIPETVVLESGGKDQSVIQSAAETFSNLEMGKNHGNVQNPVRTEQPQVMEVAQKLQAEPVKTLETGTGGENLQSGADSSGQNERETAGWFSLDHAVNGEKAVKGPESREPQKPQTTVSLEELQKKAQQNDILPFERMIGAKLSGGSAVSSAGTRGTAEAAPIPEQLRAGIEQGIAKQLNQFTIRLKPEGLGEILVHMTSSGGKIALSIGVTNQDTHKILSGEMMHLKETLEPLHAEVQEIYHNSQGGMEMMNYEQGFFQNQQRSMTGTVRRHLIRTADEDAEETAEDLQVEELAGRMAGYGRLSAYI